MQAYSAFLQLTDNKGNLLYLIFYLPFVFAEVVKLVKQHLVCNNA